MGDATRSSKDSLVHNVSLHRRGKVEYGLLSLTKHHLTFTYTPGAAKDATTEPDGGKRTSSAHNNFPPSKGDIKPVHSQIASEPVTAENASGGATPSHVDSTPSKSPAARSKVRPKTIWIAYPMINHCVLQPSHSQSYTTRKPPGNEGSPSGANDNELFPPTHGTNTYSGGLSTDSSQFTPLASPRRIASPAPGSDATSSPAESGRQPAIRIRCRDFQMMAFHFHSSALKPPDTSARETFLELRSRCCVNKVEDLLAFHFTCPKEELEAVIPEYDARKEFARMGISGKSAEGPGSAWRITDINSDYGFSETYPSVLCVPSTVSDNILKYGGDYRKRFRVPSLSYLHFNGGSITRSSQPMTGALGNRNPQDECLVQAMFQSHTLTQDFLDEPRQQGSTATQPGDLNSSAADSDNPVIGASQREAPLGNHEDAMSVPLKKKIYGSTRQNFIVDARSQLAALANRALGGGFENPANYTGNGAWVVDSVFLNIENIHKMRTSLDSVIASFANSDYVDLPPNQDILRKSGWIGHIHALLEGSERVAKVVGLSGSHVLIHCSDGWDRTSQVSALAQLMLDPYYRTLDGFITLVQKDFLSYGHKFAERTGIQGSEKWFQIENERIAPSSSRGGAEGTKKITAIGTKLLTGAKGMLNKGRETVFRQQNLSHEELSYQPSPPSTPPSGANNRKEENEHKTKTDEISPVFHQFLDAVYQLQRHHPTGFEFNERFLLRLLYQVYSGQYGEFLFDNERERQQKKGKTPSVWAHFFARKEEFTNRSFGPSPDNAFLLPLRGTDKRIDVLWWNNLFKRTSEEMNVPRALAAAPEPALIVPQSPVVSLDGTEPPGHSFVKVQPFPSMGAQSRPAASPKRDSLESEFSVLSTPSNARNYMEEPAAPLFKSTPLNATPEVNESASYENGTTTAVGVSAGTKSAEEVKQEVPEVVVDEDDDPLGVTSSMKRKENSDALDFSSRNDRFG